MQVKKKNFRFSQGHPIKSTFTFKFNYIVELKGEILCFNLHFLSLAYFPCNITRCKICNTVIQTGVPDVM